MRPLKGFRDTLEASRRRPRDPLRASRNTVKASRDLQVETSRDSLKVSRVPTEFLKDSFP